LIILSIKKSLNIKKLTLKNNKINVIAIAENVSLTDSAVYKKMNKLFISCIKVYSENGKI
ncbi:hypothetical protein, partial [Streptococcus pneumoniae]